MDMLFPMAMVNASGPSVNCRAFWKARLSAPGSSPRGNSAR